MPNEFRVKRGLVVEGSGSNVVTVDGVSGRLFLVTDALSGSLFSVNTAAGVPLMEAFSDNTVRIGQFGSRALFVSQSRVGIGKESGLNGTLDISGSLVVTGSIIGTASFATTASHAITASFALNAGGGGGGSAFPFNGRAVITGSLFVSSSTTGSTFLGSGSNILTVDGVSGRLFSVNDSFSGSLFSVNTIGGLPIMEVFSDNTVRVGQYGTQALFVSQSRVGIGKEASLNSALDVSGSVTFQKTFNRVTGSYTLVLTDASKVIEMSASAGGTYNVTVPPSSSVNFINGAFVDVALYGTGSILFVTGSGVTIRSANNWLKMDTRYGVSTLLKISANEWYLFGNINA